MFRITNLKTYVTCTGSACTKSSSESTQDLPANEMCVYNECANTNDLKVMAEALAEVEGMNLCRMMEAAGGANSQVSLDMSWDTEVACASATSGKVSHARDVETQELSRAPAMPVAPAVMMFLAVSLACATQKAYNGV